MKDRVLFKEINAKTGMVINPEDQEDPYLMCKILSTKLIKASENEIICCNKYFNTHKKCVYHLVYDKPSFMYDFRYCGICGKFIATI